MRQTLESTGSSAYAIVLERHDFEGHVEHIRAAQIPTVTPEPVERFVGSTVAMVAARIWAVDRRYLHGVRVFVAGPTFPW